MKKREIVAIGVLLFAVIGIFIILFTWKEGKRCIKVEGASYLLLGGYYKSSSVLISDVGTVRQVEELISDGRWIEKGPFVEQSAEMTYWHILFLDRSKEILDEVYVSENGYYCCRGGKRYLMAADQALPVDVLEGLYSANKRDYSEKQGKNHTVITFGQVGKWGLKR